MATHEPIEKQDSRNFDSVTIRIDADLKRSLVEYAKERDLSVSQIIRGLLRERLVIGTDK